MGNSWRTPNISMIPGSCVREAYQTGIGFQQDAKYIVSSIQLQQSCDASKARINKLCSAMDPGWEILEEETLQETDINDNIL